MTKQDREEIEEKDIIEEMEEELEEIQNNEGEIDEDKLDKTRWKKTGEREKVKETLTRVTADFENFKKRVERDKDDMIFFLKSDILKKILPRVDDLERMIANTPDDMKSWALFEAIISLEKNFKKDLESIWVKPFNSIWEEVDPNKHDVMTKAPWEQDKIIDEFEKGYELNSKVLRHAKVVVWSWE